MRWSWVNFQYRGVLLLWKSVGQGLRACNRCGWELFGYFSLFYHLSFFSPSLWETAPYRLKYCLKGPLNKKKSNQPEIVFLISQHCILRPFIRIVLPRQFLEKKINKNFLLAPSYLPFLKEKKLGDEIFLYFSKIVAESQQIYYRAEANIYTSLVAAIS